MAMCCSLFSCYTSTSYVYALWIRRMNMSISDIIIVIVLLAAVIAALLVIIRNKRKGKGCSCGCENCTYKCPKRK